MLVVSLCSIRSNLILWFKRNFYLSYIQIQRVCVFGSYLSKPREYMFDHTIWTNRSIFDQFLNRRRFYHQLYTNIRAFLILLSHSWCLLLWEPILRVNMTERLPLRVELVSIATDFVQRNVHTRKMLHHCLKGDCEIGEEENQWKLPFQVNFLLFITCAWFGLILIMAVFKTIIDQAGEFGIWWYNAANVPIFYS